MRLEEVPDPRVERMQVIVDVKAAGVNPADTYMRSGSYARKPSLPYTPGMDGAGIVVSVGDGAKVEVGSRVYLSGTVTGSYAEKALCQASDVHPLPVRLSFAQGAAINVPYATAYRALFQRANAKAGETVLVHGASGGVGVAAIQLAHGAGMNVIGTGGTEKGREMILKEGAQHSLDHNAPNYMDKLSTLTQGRGVDVILEMLANVNLGKDLKVLAPGGRVVVIGSRGVVQIDPRDTMTRDAAILGMLLFNTPETDSKAIHNALATGFENGSLRPIVGKEIPLSEAPRAHEEVMKPGAYGKIVLVPE
jgi:NADPH2:quinone reductase